MTPEEFVELYKKHGSIKQVARVTDGMSYYTTRKVYQRAVSLGLMKAKSVGRKTNDELKSPDVEPEPVFSGERQLPETKEFSVPKKGVKTYILTSAQNNTTIHKGLWANLLALKEYCGAELLVGRFTYMKSGLGESGDKAKFTEVKSETLYGSKTVGWAPEIEQYTYDYRAQLAPGLVWCGEWQRLPTTKRPLSGYETYTGRNSGIFPHSKLEMASVANAKNEPTKFNYTTGTVTMRNYIVKGAGLQATFHHCYGALLVEVDSDGHWFVRQLNADSEGTIYDLDLRVKDGIVDNFYRPAGMTFGDIHDQESDPTIAKLNDDMTEELGPYACFYHDILNFGCRNHHERKDPFRKLQRFVRGQDNVREEVADSMEFVQRRADVWPDTLHIVVDSNHDRAMERWLRESDWRHDPINMEFFMESTLAKVKAIKNQDADFHMLRHWYGEMCGSHNHNVKFLDEDESYVLCEDANGGIECGMHGHLGPNGARGSAASFAKMGRKANVAHTHSSGIYDGIYTAGTSSKMDMGYNHGPSSWSWSHIITYPNGKRAIITMRHGKWRAGMKPIK